MRQFELDRQPVIDLLNTMARQRKQVAVIVLMSDPFIEFFKQRTLC